MSSIELSPLSEASIDEKRLETALQLLKNTVKNILNSRDSYDCFEAAYTNVYNLVLHKCGSELLEEVTHIIANFLSEKVNTELVFLKKPIYLEQINSVWQKYYRSIQLLAHIFLYLQNKFLNDSSSEDFYCITIALFRDKVTLDSRMQKMQHDDLSASIEDNRNHNIPNEILIHTTCDMLMSVGLGSRNIYENIFEARFLQRSANYFSLKSKELIDNTPSLKYVRIIEALINEETKRSQICFHPSSVPIIVDMLHKVLIQQRANVIIQKDGFFWDLLEQRNLVELKYIFHMLSQESEGFNAMLEEFRQYLRNKGMLYVTELNAMTPRSTYDQNAVIQKIIQLKNFCDNLITLFDNCSDYKQAVNIDFQYFLNAAEKSPEYIAVYFDSILKKDAKKMSQYDVDQVLKEAIQLFRYLDDKDIFERYYRQLLARRLLLNKSLGDNVEHSIIYKLKDECGYSFIQKMKCMVMDMAMSKEIDQLIRQDDLFLENIHEGFDFNIRLINAYNWPVNSDNSEYIPMEFRSAFEFYKLFYRSRKKGRKLSIHPQLGNAELCINFEKQSNQCSYCTIDVATNQMCILLLFNIKPTWTFLEIRDETKYSNETLERCLYHLCIGEINQCVLRKDPCTEVFNLSDSFTVNNNFAPGKPRLKIKLAVLSDTTKHNMLIMTRSFEDINRSPEIQAAIMRVMKHHTSMHISDMAPLVEEQCIKRFRPSTADINKEVTRLVDRDYLKPDETDRNTYIYIP